MRKNARKVVLMLILGGACLCATMAKAASSSQDDAVAMMGNYEAQQRAEAASRQKDPQWKAACHEVGLIKVGDGKKPGAVKNFCINSEGNILACFGSTDAKGASGIRIYSPDGKLLETMPLEI